MAESFIVNGVVDLPPAVLDQHIPGLESCLVYGTTFGHVGKFHTTVFLLVIGLDAKFGVPRHAFPQQRPAAGVLAVPVLCKVTVIPATLPRTSATASWG